MTGANTYSGVTTINSGATLQVANGTTGALGTGAVTDNGTLILDFSANTTVANTISGTGGLIQEDSGTVILTGANTYSGLTTINSGDTLQLGAANARVRQQHR